MSKNSLTTSYYCFCRFSLVPLHLQEIHYLQGPMGIDGLIKEIFPAYIKKKSRVDEIVAQGFTRGVVDFSDWIHTAIYSVAVLIVEDSKQQALAGCVKWFRQKFDILSRQGVKSLHFVRDGAPLPAKADTNEDRQTRRKQARDACKETKEMDRVLEFPPDTIVL